MPKLDINEVLEDPDVKLEMDPWEWENRCGACDNFYDPIRGYSKFAICKCPHEGHVTKDTNWKHLHCKKFHD